MIHIIYIKIYKMSSYFKNISSDLIWLSEATAEKVLTSAKISQDGSTTFGIFEAGHITVFIWWVNNLPTINGSFLIAIAVEVSILAEKLLTPAKNDVIAQNKKRL